jgi:hypothetical protein
MVIWYICWLLGIFAPVLVRITEKNLAALLVDPLRFQILFDAQTDSK